MPTNRECSTGSYPRQRVPVSRRHGEGARPRHGPCLRPPEARRRHPVLHGARAMARSARRRAHRCLRARGDPLPDALGRHALPERRREVGAQPCAGAAAPSAERTGARGPHGPDAGQGPDGVDPRRRGRASGVRADRGGPPPTRRLRTRCPHRRRSLDLPGPAARAGWPRRSASCPSRT